MNRIEIQSDGTGIVTLASGAEATREAIHAATWAEAQNAAVERLLNHAQQLGTTIEAVTSDPQAPRIRFSPDGTVVTLDEDTALLEEHDTPAASTPAGAAAAPETTWSPEPEQETASGQNGRSTVEEAPADPVDETSGNTDNTTAPTTDSLTQPSTPQPDPPARQNPFATSAAAPTESRRQRREQRESFLKTQRREQPATRGWRGAVASLGIRVSPSAEEREEREDQRLVSQHWPGPRTVAVVNGKGGASKTPTTILLSAIFARAGSSVAAWDNNQTRGTLGWRTEQAGHDSTVLDMLPEVDQLLGTGAQSADLARLLHHQPIDKYDVLRSQPMRLASEQRVNAEDVASIHQALAKYYRLLVMDSGNDESDPLWLKMIDLADQIVVATTTRADHAEAGALLLDSLADSEDRHSKRLADNAVAVVSQAEPKAPASDLSRIAEGYRDLAREVVEIPFDPAMVDGQLSFDALRPATQRAWLRAGAAVATGL